MTEDELIRRIAERSAPAPLPPASAAEIDAVAERLGVPLPPLYRRLLLEVGNGGFGPGNQLCGVPPHGHVDDDLRAFAIDCHEDERAAPRDEIRAPFGTVYLCTWGCGMASSLDCLGSAGRVLSSELLPEGLVFHLAAPSLHEWLERWVEGVDLAGELREIVGHVEHMNAFTKQPQRVPKTRMRGPRVDLRDRQRPDYRPPRGPPYR